MPLTVTWTNNSGVAVATSVFDINLATINRILNARIAQEPPGTTMTQEQAAKALAREFMHDLRRLDRSAREEAAKAAAIAALGTDPPVVET
jgi:hypothetical protein